MILPLKPSFIMFNFAATDVNYIILIQLSNFIGLSAFFIFSVERHSKARRVANESARRRSPRRLTAAIFSRPTIDQYFLIKDKNTNPGN